MKNTDIAKIRQLAKGIKGVVGYALKPSPVERRCVFLAKKILALLPCETCDGKETIFAPKDITGMCVTIPCPDCQPKSCICCEEITEENAHLHRNCGK